MTPLTHNAIPVQSEDGSWKAIIRVEGFTDLPDVKAWCIEFSDTGLLVLPRVETKKK